MQINDTIIISKDFSQTPGARYIIDGHSSGQLFLETILLPKFLKAVEGNHIILIDLDNLKGLPPSFVSGSFGKLSIDYSPSILLKHFQFKSDDNPLREQKIVNEIKNPIKD